MFEQTLEEQLKAIGITRNEYSELLIRLLDYGVICRNESQIEATLYDRYIQCAELVESYLSLIAVRIQHDKQFTFVRVYPPAAQVPGLSDENDQPFSGGFRVRPTQQEVALIIVLRAEYEKSLREGQIQDDGSTMLSMEALSIAMNNMLKRNLPESLVERKTLFRRLRQLRLISMSVEDDFDMEESWIRIQPSITSFVTEEVLASIADQVHAFTQAEGQADSQDDVLEKGAGKESIGNDDNSSMFIAGEKNEEKEQTNEEKA